MIVNIVKYQILSMQFFSENIMHNMKTLFNFTIK